MLSQPNLNIINSFSNAGRLQLNVVIQSRQKTKTNTCMSKAGSSREENQHHMPSSRRGV
jgi:hypothetical protein